MYSQKMLPKRNQNHQGLKILGRIWFTRGMHESSSLTGLQPSVTILRLLVVWRRFPSDRWERRLVWARKYELSTRRGLTVDQWELHRHWKILDFLVKKDRGSRLDFILATMTLVVFTLNVFSIEYRLLRITDLKNFLLEIINLKEFV